MTDSLPSGTVTLLFTDIEGSSLLWDTHRAEMSGALRQHNELLTGSISGNDGIVVKDKGDGFFAVFSSAEGAVVCALESQRALSAAAWPDPIDTIKVRMAIHSGTVENEDGDYRGPVVNRVARLEGIAHGGQVLISDATRGLVADVLPPDVSLRELGSYTLRGMERPERVFQLAAPDLPDDFPALRTDGGGGVALPSYPTSFVGRSGEQAAIDDLFETADARLVTLLGPGGIGKTRLAVETAREIGGRLAGGVFFADLARISSAGDVGLAIAEAVGAHTEGTASPVALAAARISRPTLLVLDNFEHVQEAATTVAELIDGSAKVRLIATSRAPLRISGERIFPVEPLGSGNGNGSMPPAVALFYERVAGYGVYLAEDGPEAESARAIVRRLDGLPLAIELVAARTRLLGIAELEAMLARSLDALGSGAADVPERQKTIRSTIEWSLQALTLEQRRLFAQLSVFPAGATFSQLSAVAGPDRDGDLLDDLTALVDNSLVNVARDLPGGTRNRQLVLLRDYGAELLEQAGESNVVMGRLVDHYRSTSPELGRRIQTSEIPHDEIRADHANLVAAMVWSLDHDRIAEMVDVVCNTWVYWFNGDLAVNAAEWVAKADPLLDSTKLDWLNGFFALQAGRVETAVGRLMLAREGFEEVGDSEWVARSNIFIAMITQDPEAGRSMAAAAVAHLEPYEPGVDLFMARLILSTFSLALGDIDRATQVREDLLAWAETRDYLTLIAWAEWNLALAYLAGDRVDEADRHNRSALDRMVLAGYQEGVASAADLVAVIEIKRGNTEQGLRVLGGAESVWKAVGTFRWPESTAEAEAALATARESLGEAETERCLAEGRALSLEDLIELISSGM
jgi:predicted ATPase/class 3 adenylate cyclase